MDQESVWAALEASTDPKRKNGPTLDPPATATRNMTLAWKRRLMLFLEEVDGDMTVADLREALEAYER